MPCTRCGSEQPGKNGLMRGNQRYECLACGYKYTDGAGMAYPVEKRALALKRYLEGLGLRAVGRVLAVSNVPVLRWVRAYGQRAEQQAAQAPAQAVRVGEVNEVPRSVGEKKRLLGRARGRPGTKAGVACGSRGPRPGNGGPAVRLAGAPLIPARLL
jgi:transposase-like protein